PGAAGAALRRIPRRAGQRKQGGQRGSEPGTPGGSVRCRERSNHLHSMLKVVSGTESERECDLEKRLCARRLGFRGRRNALPGKVIDIREQPQVGRKLV